MRLILAVILFAVSQVASAQVTRDCVTQTCTVVCDPISGTPAGIPDGVRLYSGTTLLAEHPVTAPYACNFVRNFAAGPWSLTARYYNATGEGPDSNVLTFTSAVPLPLPPAPSNLRFP